MEARGWKFKNPEHSYFQQNVLIYSYLKQINTNNQQVK